MREISFRRKKNMVISRSDRSLDSSKKHPACIGSFDAEFKFTACLKEIICLGFKTRY